MPMKFQKVSYNVHNTIVEIVYGKCRNIFASIIDRPIEIQNRGDRSDLDLDRVIKIPASVLHGDRSTRPISRFAVSHMKVIKIAIAASKWQRERERTQEYTGWMEKFRATRSPHSAPNCTPEDRISDSIRGHDACTNVRSTRLSRPFPSRSSCTTSPCVYIMRTCVFVCVSFARFYGLVSLAGSVNDGSRCLHGQFSQRVSST